MRFYKRTWNLGTIESARPDGTFGEWVTMPDDAPVGQLMHVYAETNEPARIVALKPDVPESHRPRIGDHRDKLRKQFDRRLRRAGRWMDDRADGGTWPAVVALVGSLGLLAGAILLTSKQQR